MTEFVIYTSLVIAVVLCPFAWYMAWLCGERAKEWQSRATRSEALARRFDAPDVTHLEHDELVRQLNSMIGEAQALDKRSIFDRGANGR